VTLVAKDAIVAEPMFLQALFRVFWAGQAVWMETFTAEIAA
jgi:hypothetical protein